MRGGAWPAAMALAALALALGFVPRRAAGVAMLLALGIAAAIGFVAVPAAWIDVVFLGCWAGIIVVASSVYLARPPLLPALAALTGVAAGLMLAAQGTPADLLRALPATVIVFPAAFAVRCGYAIGPRVVASWLIAVALLAACLPYAVSHPGYVPDHME